MEYKIRQLFPKDKSEAEEEFSKIKATPHGIKIMSEKLSNIVLKIKDVDNKAANIIKQEMLARNGEAVISRDALYLGNEKSDVIIFVVDGKEEITSNDKLVAKMLQKANKEVIVAVNKIDDVKKTINIEIIKIAKCFDLCLLKSKNKKLKKTLFFIYKIQVVYL